jgi:H+/Cl- antiporter ClcA
MTTIWRKLLVGAAVAVVLGMAGIYDIVSFLSRHGIPEMFQGISDRFLTGTAVAVILALLILLKSSDR